MPELLDLAQFGVAIFSIGVVLLIVKEFLKFLKNEMEHLRQDIQRHTEIDDRLAEAVKQLLDYLKFHNGRNKKKK